jgi:hypothetical protein
MPKEILYVDTCVVIEAVRTNCWNAVAGHFEIRTVEAVSQELTKKPAIVHSYVKVDMNTFQKQSSIEKCPHQELLQAGSKSQRIWEPDKGEQDLLAHVFCLQSAELLVTTGDGLAVNVACALGLSDSLISLEEVAEKCGQRPKLNYWFTKSWLQNQKTSFLLDTV